MLRGEFWADSVISTGISQLIMGATYMEELDLVSLESSYNVI